MGEETDLKIQNITKLYTLVLLKSTEKEIIQEEKHNITGYYILKKLKDDLGKTSSPTYVYEFLKDLKEKGYIEELATGESKRSKGFKLTPSGAAFIDRIFSRFDNLIAVAIQSKLKICSSCGVQLYDKVHIETIHGDEMNFCCKHCAKAYKDQLHDH
jgi:DNA-binding PadR family transcriptional regulator